MDDVGVGIGCQSDGIEGCRFLGLTLGEAADLCQLDTEYGQRGVPAIGATVGQSRPVWDLWPGHGRGGVD